MPAIDFGKLNAKRSDGRNKSPTKEVIKEGVYATIFSTGACFKANHNGTMYHITEKSRTTVKKKFIYSIDKLDNGRRFVIIRDDRACRNYQHEKFYSPIYDGLLVKGNIIAIGMTTYFDIKKHINRYESPECFDDYGNLIIVNYGNNS